MYNYTRRAFDRDKIVRGRLLSTIEKLDRIILGRKKLTVNWSSKDEAIAFNQGGDIYLSSAHFSNIHDIDTVVAVIGANYHEVAHLMYSPTNEEPFMYSVRSSGQSMFKAYNYLEDVRIEALFSARYEKAKKYFLSMFLDVMIKSTDHTSMFLIAHGRRFIPRSVRLELEKMFKEENGVSDQDMVEFKRVIDSYRKLSKNKFTRNGSAMLLVRDFEALIDKYTVKPPPSQCDDSTNSSDSNENALVEAKQVAQETQKQDKEEEKEEEKTEGENSEEGESEDGEDSDEGQDGGDDGDEGEDDSDGGSVDSDGESEGDESESDQGQDGVGGDGESESLVERALQIKGELREDEDVRMEVDHIRAALNSNTNNIKDLENTRGLVEVPVSANLKSVSAVVQRELRKLYAELEGGWKYGSDTGVVNISRAMMPDADSDEIYDQWDEGTQTDVGMELIVLLDTSQSMIGDKMNRAEDAMWVVKNALDEIDARITVISFDESTGMVYGPDDRASTSKMYRVSNFGGDTQPAEGMQVARRRLTESNAPHKLFMVITDGIWGHYGQTGLYAETIDETLAGMPGTNVYVGIGTQCRPQYDKYFNVNRVISDPVDIVSIVRDIVTQILREARR